MKKSLKQGCPECGSANVIFNQAKDQLACQDCGLLFEELLQKDEKIEEEVSRKKVPKKQ